MSRSSCLRFIVLAAGLARSFGAEPGFVLAASGITNSLNAITTDNTNFVTVGDAGSNGSIFGVSSGQATNFTFTSFAPSQNLRAVAYGTSGFVASGDSARVFTSADGSSWTAGNSAFTVSFPVRGLAF